MTAEQLGELAYVAFCSSTHHKNLRGEPYPRWETLDPRKQSAWCDAARAIWWRVMGTEMAPAKIVLDDVPTSECPHCGFLWPPGYDFVRCPGCQQVYDGG